LSVVVACPKCGKSFPDHTARCPTDGTLLTSASLAATTPAPASDIGATALDVKPTPDELEVGAVVGEYKITGKIGESGMGTVYAGVHPVIGKRVAVKVLNAGLSQDAGIVQRFVHPRRGVRCAGGRARRRDRSP
jgi:serine/threonine-protein kinase